MRRLVSVLLCICMLTLPLPVLAKGEGYIVRLSPSAPRLLTGEDGVFLPYIGVETEEDAKTLVDCGFAEFYTENGEVTLFEDSTWAVEMLQIPAAYDCRFTGAGIVAAVIDSGVDSDNPYLDGRLVTGYNVMTASADTEDTYGHGTGVAGVICGADGLGTAPDAQIMPVKAFDGRTTSYLNIANAIHYVTNYTDCKLINMSFGFAGNNSSIETEVRSALQKGVTIVAAVGNEGRTTLMYPAAYDGVIGVGAVTRAGTRASISQYNASVDLTAPGAFVQTITINGTTKEQSGTSFAAPFVTGLCAMARQYNPSLSTEALFSALTETAADKGTAGRDDEYGYGLCDAAAFLGKIYPESHALRTLCGEDFSKMSFALAPDGYHVSALLTEDVAPQTPVRLSAFSKLANLQLQRQATEAVILNATLYTAVDAVLYEAEYTDAHVLAQFAYQVCAPGVYPLKLGGANIKRFLFGQALNPLI